MDEAEYSIEDLALDDQRFVPVFNRGESFDTLCMKRDYDGGDPDRVCGQTPRRTMEILN